MPAPAAVGRSALQLLRQLVRGVLEALRYSRRLAALRMIEDYRRQCGA
jgi:hypothetical protein